MILLNYYKEIIKYIPLALKNKTQILMIRKSNKHTWNVFVF